MDRICGKLLALVLAHCVVSQHSQCREPTKYPDRQLDDKYLPTSAFQDGDKVAYRCAAGHAQTGGSRLSFCEDGRWTPLNLTCGKKKCGPLRDIENGRYIQDGRSFGASAAVVCNKGYVLRGDRIRVCGENGWNGTDPVCENTYKQISLQSGEAHQLCGPPETWLEDPDAETAISDSL